MPPQPISSPRSVDSRPRDSFGPSMFHSKKFKKHKQFSLYKPTNYFSISVPNFQMPQPISSPRSTAPSPILPSRSTSDNVTTNSNEVFNDDLAGIDQDSLFGEF